MTAILLDPALPELCACIVLANWDRVREIRRSTRSEDLDRSWREAVLQTHLFAGFPRLVEAYDVLAAEGGLGTPEPDESGIEGSDLERQRAAGRDLFERIYSHRAPAVRRSLESFHPDLAAWIEQHAYGRVLARPGLSVAAREILAVACLIVLDQPRQLMSHVRGAVYCGAGRADLQAALESVRELVPSEVIRRAQHILDQVQAENPSDH